MKYKLFILLFLFSISTSFAQLNKILYQLDKAYKHNESENILILTDSALNYDTNIKENFYFLKSQAYRQLKQTDNAIIYLKKTLKIKKSNPDYHSFKGLAYWHLGNIYSMQNKNRKSLRMYVKASKLCQSSYLFSTVAYKQIEFKKYKKALNNLNIAIKIDSTNAYAYSNRALLYTKTSNYELARQDINTSISYDSTNPFVYKHSALLYIELKDYNNACKELHKALNLNTGNIPVINEQDKIKALIKKYCSSTENTCSTCDTIYIDKKIEYFSKDGDNLKDFKNYKSIPKRAREKIRISQDSFKIEHCYYFDNKRQITDYTIYYNTLNDSIVKFNNQEWIYQKNQENKFTVYKSGNHYTETGTCTSIIPFERDGNFYITNCNKDTLLTEIYKENKLISYDLPQTIINDTIYKVADTLPQFPEQYGSLMQYLSENIIFPEICMNSSIQRKVYIQFIITKTGKVKNLKVIKGVDLLLDISAIKAIASLPNFIPAQKNGEAINYSFLIPISFKLY